MEEFATIQTYNFGSRWHPQKIHVRIPLLENVWESMHRDHCKVELYETTKRIPEIVFTFQEVNEVYFRAKATDDMLASLSRLKNLESVRIGDASEISRNGLVSLTKCTKLRHLELFKCALPIEDFAFFEPHPNLNLKLELVRETHSSDTPDGDRRWIAALSRLRHVSLKLGFVCDVERIHSIYSIRSLGELNLSDGQCVDGKTLLQSKRFAPSSAQNLTIQGIGDSIPLAKAVAATEWFNRNVSTNLVFSNSPLTGDDISTLKRLSQWTSRCGTIPVPTMPSANSSNNPKTVSITCRVDEDDVLERLFEIRSYKMVNVTARGITEHGLRSLSRFADWDGWTMSLDFRDSPCPVHLWAEQIPKSLAWRIILTPESLSTDKDIECIRTDLLGRHPNSIERPNWLHIVCNKPTPEFIERLKSMPFPAQLVVDLADQEVTPDELIRVIEAIPTSDFSIDLRLPRNMVLTERDARVLKQLNRFEKLRLELVSYASRNVPSYANRNVPTMLVSQRRRACPSQFD